jgi:predicted nucleotidyltransferase
MFKVKEIGIFGSRARGEDRKKERFGYTGCVL